MSDSRLAVRKPGMERRSLPFRKIGGRVQDEQGI